MSQLWGEKLATSHGYHPATQDLILLLESTNDPHALFLGSQVQDLEYGVIPVRHVRDPEVVMPPGLYWFHDQDVLRILHVSNLEAPVASETIPSSQVDSGHPVVAAGGWHKALCGRALRR